ncbi:ParB N-terminal domain-containing protein [Micromonospora peucetia]|uniref:ParB N-terminal domain-containing protein n=1 Tax=Micromonospora peucetia TaxID=47871 RepID=A0ABZ1EJA7_9ACTN|nr:ParB N-terminal domain-containing protein [Micromonospora peucetia]MCX4386956.1 ParB N-terminal domain-containing protein [Micromonospora peucetia]WSA34326.1 ParB N-terminal domain-containing protein [Micromonospora peucetia]
MIESLLPARSPRLKGEDPEHIQALAETDAQLPPIIVHRATMRIIDGAHRVAAARSRGVTSIAACFFDGTDQEAFALAVRANITHGLPLTHAERVAAATVLIQQNPSWSDRSVAATSGLSPGTVKGVRQRAVPEGARDEARIGRDGRARPTDPIEKRQQIREVIERSPGASLREVAKQVGVSPSTVRDVRCRMQREMGAEEPSALSGSATDRRIDQPAPKLRQVTGQSQVADINATLDSLTRDPSLRFTESGRAMLRWLSTRAVRPGEWHQLVSQLPPHTAYIFANLAQQCADEWGRLALSLKQQTREAG